MTFLGVSLLFLCMIYPVSAVGVFRNSEGNWYLDYNNTGIIDKTIAFRNTRRYSDDWRLAWGRK